MTVTALGGFRPGGAAAGLKSSGAPDVALVVDDGPSDVAAAVFTGNRCKANPVLWSECAVADHRAKAVLLNSGGANCYTGPEGFQATHSSAEFVARLLGVGPVGVGVVVCSTGLIGRPPPRGPLFAGIEAVTERLDTADGPAAADAIMTTDTRPKQVVCEGTGYRIGGMAKGAGILAPALATMLVVLTTDADTTDGALREATRRTFDRLDSDGCMSTNDTVVLLCSGASGITPDAREFTASLTDACHDLTRELLGDAEGSEHDITIDVVNAATETDALAVGRAIARSNPVKAAVFGRDPNWGRILAVAETTEVVFDPAALDVAANGVWICRSGGPGKPADAVDPSARAVSVTVDLKAGTESATIWTNDLTHAYVHENSAYST